MVFSSVSETTGSLVGDAQRLCNSGINTVPGVGGPVALSLVFHKDQRNPVRTLCSYPTSSATSALGCDAVISDVPFRRFCPCVNFDCDAPPSVWYLGESGDSCRSTCNSADAACEAGPLKNIITPAGFSHVLATAVDISSGMPIVTSGEEICNGGTNVFDFASAPAITTTHVQGGSNVTFCNFPESAEELQGDCDASFPGFGTRRFCSCRPAAHATRHRALLEAATVDARTVTRGARRQLRGRV